VKISIVACGILCYLARSVERPLLADSVEKLLDDSFSEVFGGPLPPNRC